jgi:hypothetical protein
MSNSGVRVGVGTRVVYDGEPLEVAELHAGSSGTETVLRSCGGKGGIVRVTLREHTAVTDGIERRPSEAK